MPKGLKFNSKTGKITGRPSQVWNKKIKITASNKAGKVTKTVRLKITEAALAKKKTTVKSANTAKAVEFIKTASNNYESKITATEAFIASGPVNLNHEACSIMTQDFKAGAQPDEYIIACVLPEIEISESKLYDFTAELSPDIETGAKLIWLAGAVDSDFSDDDTIAEFYDYDSGDEIDSVPENHKINIAAWLTEGKIYKPVIAVKKQKH